MFRRNKSTDICSECKNEIGEARPTLSLMTNRGMFLLCNPCKIKFEEVTIKDKEDRPLLRQCEFCETITAEDYTPCILIDEPDIQFWLCSSCYKEWEAKEKIGEN
jgi:hypothetical protein